MNNSSLYLLFALALLLFQCSSSSEEKNGDEVHPDLRYSEGEVINEKANGYRGIWYMNQPLDNKYKYKYSGGLATYTAKHNPFAIYREEVDKTFFTYGGTDEENSTLLHMVSYYDHETGEVARPTIVLDKKTTDAHDNPVMSIDEEGYIYIFSTSHGTSRPSYISKSRTPYDISAFEKIEATKIEEGERVSMDNFSYVQSWYQADRGFVTFFTRYGYPADRTICFMTSPDGGNWSEWKRIAAIKKGHYQISSVGDGVAGSAFNFHPDTEEKRGLNWRTNLYYVETRDFGDSWQAADGSPLELPLTDIENPALVHDYESKDLNVYMKDITYDREGRPVILYITSKGYEAGPQNDPRTWRTARWTGEDWVINDVTTSDNNYDMGSLYIEDDGTWRIIAPTETGPQPYNPGGEVAMWESRDQGQSWQKVKELTSGSDFNHTYVRRPLTAHPEFYGIWADGHGRQPSKSNLYFSNKEGEVFQLPEHMEQEMESVEQID